MRPSPVLWLLLGATLITGRSLASDDWPAYLHDASRSGSTAQALAIPLHLAWTRKSPFPPTPAWSEPAARDLLHRLDGLLRVDEFDLAFHPVVAEGWLFYGSSSTDTLYCLDAASGKLLWTHVTEGPIRVVPACSEGRVYCGSDDGRLYCLEALSGQVLWRYRPGLDDRRLPGNSRMISRWPVRSGLVVQGGRVYCAAGVFPGEGVFLCAVDSRDGREIWRREVQTTAHGPMVASATRLFVPALRGPVQSFDLATGNPTGDAGSGGSLAALVGGQLVTGPNEKGMITGLNPQVLSAIGPARSLHLTATSQGGAVLASERVLLAVDPQQRVLWKVLRKNTHALMAASDTLFVGGTGEITAHRADNGEQLWRGEVKGAVRALAAAGGAVFASTDDGSIYCFRSEKQAPAEHAVSQLPFPDSPTGAACQTAARAIAEHAGVTKGYCLVLGSGDGRLACELAKMTDLHVIGVEQDQAAVAQSRQHLAAARLYGPRAVIHRWPEDNGPETRATGGDGPKAHGAARLPYQDATFNLVVSQRHLESGQPPPVPSSEVLRVLRPEGGALVLVADTKADQQAIGQWGAGLPGWKVELLAGNLLGTARRGGLPGAGAWTHQYADSGNSACSGDRLATGPMELQWFGPPGPRSMVDRHNRTSAPLCHEGRLFIAGEESLAAVDAYNGTLLWQQGVPKPVRLSVSMDCGHVAAGNGAVYIAAGSRCKSLDAATGRCHCTFEVPDVGDETARQWAYVGVLGDTLLGSASRPGKTWQTLSPDSWTLGYLDNSAIGCSRGLFAFSTRTRQRLWTYRPAGGVLINPTLAASSGRIIFVESLNPETLKAAEARIGLRTLVEKGARLVALDAMTGSVAWSRPVDLSQLQHSPFLAVAQGVILVSGAKNVGSHVHYELHAFRQADGSPLWSRSYPTEDRIGGSHGEQNQHPVIVGDRIIFKAFCCSLSTGAPQSNWRLPAGGCGTLSASQGLCFFRSFVATAADLSTGECWPLTTVSRPGCWINLIPAGGLVLSPEASSGCTCPIPLQTSFAMRPMDCPLPAIHAASATPPKPTMRPADCRIAVRSRVEISHPDPAAKLYYTLDGTWPTPSSATYNGPLEIASPTTVRAIAQLPTGKRSVVVQRRFTPVDTPVVLTPSSKFVTCLPVELEKLHGAAVLRYTLDGASPTANSPPYQQPIELTETATLTAAYFLDSRRAGPECVKRFEKVPGMKPVQPPPLSPGLSYSYYEGDVWQRLPDFAAMPALRRGTVPDFTLPSPRRAQTCGVWFQGFIDIPADSVYTFFLRSDDGSKLRIGDTLLVDNDGLHDARGERRGEIALARGMHPIQVLFFNGGLQDFLSVQYQAPGLPKQPIPARILHHAKDARAGP